MSDENDRICIKLVRKIQEIKLEYLKMILTLKYLF